MVKQLDIPQATTTTPAQDGWGRRIIFDGSGDPRDCKFLLSNIGGPSLGIQGTNHVIKPGEWMIYYASKIEIENQNTGSAGTIEVEYLG